MKSIKNIMVFSFFLIGGIAFTSCGNSNKASTEMSEDKDGKEYTSAYVCPMHCKGSGSETEGNCPVCNMVYVVNEDAVKGGHDHDDHEGHNH